MTKKSSFTISLYHTVHSSMSKSTFKFSEDYNVLSDIANNWEFSPCTTPYHFPGDPLPDPIQRCQRFSSHPNFFLFPRLKALMKKYRFGRVDNVKMACTKTLKVIPKVAYRNVFDD